MMKPLDTKDLTALRLELIYAAQKAERLMIATLSDEHRQKNPRNYTADQLNAGKKEVQHAALMLRMAAKNLLPTFETLATEEIPV